MTTTTKLQDYNGRWLTNATPGTSAATDFLGRFIVASDKDYMGRSLLFSNPSSWASAHAYSSGAFVRLSGGAILQCGTAGTSAGSAPTPPAVNATVTDNTAVWTRLH